MVKYAITHLDNGFCRYLVMFGYDGGKWYCKFAEGDLFRPVTVPTLREAYILLMFIESLRSEYQGVLFVEEVDTNG